ncbi:MAG: acyl carrier protein [Victivallales bacterium]|nr:acyl carrier protein [Victivallales bacterium]
MTADKSTDQISSELASYIEALTSTENKISHESTFKEMGIDSISLVKILVFIEKKYGISLIGTKLGREDLATFGKLVEHIARHE